MRASFTIGNLLASVFIGLLSTSCGGGGAKATSPTAPTNPENTNFTGTWAGTLSRPAGLGSIAVRWVGTQGSQGQLSGPFAMTYNSVTVTPSFEGSFAGGKETPAGITFRITLIAGASTVVPSCSIQSTGPTTMVGFATAATSLTSNPFDLQYSNCQGFIDNDVQRSQHIDSGSVLTLTKQ